MRFEVKVGLIVFLSIVVFVGVYWFLGGITLTSSTYPTYTEFPNVLKLDKGADVRMAGVKIGIVRSVELTKDSKVRVNMMIDLNIKIPADSCAKVTTGGFIGDTYVDIIPGARNKMIRANQKIASKMATSFDQLTENVDILLQKLQKTADSVNNVLGDKDLVGSLEKTMKNIASASDSANKMMASAKNLIDKSSPDVEETLKNLKNATMQAAMLGEQMQEMISKDLRPDLTALMGQAKDSMENLNKTIVSAKNLMGAFGEAPAKINSTLEKVDSAAAQAKEMMIKLNEASSGIRDITTDKEMKENLKTTVKNIAEASEEAKVLLDGLNKKLGMKKVEKSVRKVNAPEEGTVVNNLWNTDKGSYRVDANYTSDLNENDFFRVGAYDVGENTKMTAQMGKMFGSSSLRYGLYASRLGLGYDLKFNKNLQISADLFRPNDPNLEVRSIINFGGGYGLYGGVKDIFQKDRRDLLVGVRYTNK